MPDEGKSATKIATVVASYFVVSITMVFLNKKLLGLEAPLFITWYQCVITALIIWALGKLGETAESKDAWVAQFPKFEYHIPIAMKIMTLSMIFVGMIAMNNLCLKYVEVSFYNVARSLTMCFNVVFTFIILGDQTSMKVMSTLLLVIFGFWCGTEGEANFSLIGTLFGVGSSVFVSLNSIYCKKFLPVVDDNQWKLTLYNNINASILFLPLIVLFEFENLTHPDAIALFFTFRFWWEMTWGGVFGFMIGIVTVMQIKVTSPLTHNISGTAKACVQTILAFMIYGNPVTSQGAFGIFLVIFGSGVYTYVRHTEMQQKKAIEMQRLKGEGPKI
eukprot:GFYU01009748.1.p1 GENE.GFYU01009748.1~~GFYU01009748.1.p1  ORF type:complete len:332 (-),score=134.92 GFYU01009748.1:209-1204(-)